ncbi:hypothetical protein PVAP13_7KG214155 [Panicum virgatum]|uniref:Uncharacterized protein n=1 Tax=Panicum virgatum TaxID=38727 RepID=A0A8T0QIL0_PANVG|nr:hypothetical protein PVAP13_7KG214155 [Panicum virgatum]
MRNRFAGSGAQARHGIVHALRDDAHARLVGRRRHGATSPPPPPPGEGRNSWASRQSQGAGDWLHFFLCSSLTPPFKAAVYLFEGFKSAPTVLPFADLLWWCMMPARHGQPPRADGQRRRASQLLREHATPPEGRVLPRNASTGSEFDLLGAPSDSVRSVLYSY